MPTFYDPGADAGEASEALRGLAHATRTFENPQDLYGVIGDLLSGVRSLKQVLDQLAIAHAENRPRAFDDHGDHTIGSEDALAAAAELHQAATLIDQAEERLDAAAGAASRVAWHEAPAGEALTIARWINVIFMQGQEADEVLEMIDTDGALAGLDHLKYWDYGDETTSAAMENGYVYDVPPSGPLEHELHDGDYHLVYRRPNFSSWRCSRVILQPRSCRARHGMRGFHGCGPLLVPLASAVLDLDDRRDLLRNRRPEIDFHFRRFDTHHKRVIDASVALVQFRAVLPPTHDGINGNGFLARKIDR